MTEYNFKLKKDRLSFYNKLPWRGKNGIRSQVLARDKECVWCKEQGLVTTPEMGRLEIDHIKILEHGTYEDAIDLNNLRTLCSYHHNERHERFNGREFEQNKYIEDEKW